MKKIFFLLLFSALVLGAVSGNAQVKIGRLSIQEVISLMPEKDSAESKLKAYSEDLQKQMEAMQVEFNNKLQDYQKTASTLTDVIRQQKEKELQDIQNRFSEFQETAQQDYQNVQFNLMGPVYRKAQEAIQKVSKENGLTIVLDTGAGGLLYFDEATTVDLLPMVKKELGINK